MVAVHRDGERISFAIRVTPRASANGVGGEREGALVVRVTAPPVAGRANEAAITALAEALGVSRASVRLESGAASRTKRVSAPKEAEPALRELAK